MFVNVDSSFDIENRLLKLSVVIIGMLMEGAVSQSFYLGPSLFLMWLQKLTHMIIMHWRCTFHVYIGFMNY